MTTNLEKKEAWKPWEVHNIVSSLPTISLEDLNDYFVKIANSNINYTASLIMLYLTGSRQSEIFASKRYNTPGLKQNNISEINLKGTRWMIVKTPALKRGKKEFKEAYLDVEDERYAPMMGILLTYLQVQKEDPEAMVFPGLKANTISKWLLKKDFKFNLHYLRGLRAKHLNMYHDFSEIDLRAYFGWEDNSPMPNKYCKVSRESLMYKLKGENGLD